MYLMRPVKTDRPVHTCLANPRRCSEILCLRYGLNHKARFTPSEVSVASLKRPAICLALFQWAI